MKETIINEPYAETLDLTKQTDIPQDSFGKIRIYKYSPDAILFQIRTSGPVTDSGKGIHRNIATSTIISVDQAQEIITGLQSYISSIQGEV